MPRQVFRVDSPISVPDVDKEREKVTAAGVVEREQDDKTKKLVADLVRIDRELRTIKSPYTTRFISIAGYLDDVNRTFYDDSGKTTNAPVSGTTNITNSKAIRASRVSASAMLGMLWPQARNNAILRPTPPADGRGVSKERKEYFEFVTNQVVNALEDPTAGLRLALEEYMYDMVAYGTSAIEFVDSKESDVAFRSRGVDELKISEDGQGRVRTIFLTQSMSLTQLISFYGENNVSKKTTAMHYKSAHEKRIEVLTVIRPRTDVKDTDGVEGTPFESFHVDVENNYLMKRSGFEDIPVIVARLVKNARSTYGQGLAMDALGDIAVANKVAADLQALVAKITNPPVGVFSSSVSGNVIDNSERGVTVVNPTGISEVDKQPIFPLFPQGDPSVSAEYLQKLEQDIADDFLIDRLLDFNNKTTMTLGEARIRDKLRNMSLGTVLARQIHELFTPLIQGVVNRLNAAGKLGVMPGTTAAEGVNVRVIPSEVAEDMRAGRNVYEIVYQTPAMRVMSSEELEGLMRLWEFTAGLAVPLDSTAAFNLKSSEAIRRIVQSLGISSEVVSSDEEIKSQQEAQQQVNEQQMQAQQVKDGAQAARDIGQSGLLGNQQGGQQ